jgi:hypothetical protein
MEPMKPMKPMEPMKPFASFEKWWPEDLGEASSSGAQNGMRYAFFPEKRRLIIEDDGKRTTYDSAGHQINGVSQQNSGRHSLTFTSQDGLVDLNELERVD